LRFFYLDPLAGFTFSIASNDRGTITPESNIPVRARRASSDN